MVISSISLTKSTNNGAIRRSEAIDGRDDEGDHLSAVRETSDAGGREKNFLGSESSYGREAQDISRKSVRISS